MFFGYFFVGFELLLIVYLLRCELCSKFFLIFDFLYENDWKVLVENIGFSYIDIRWIESRIVFFLIEIFFDFWEIIDSLKF